MIKIDHSCLHWWQDQIVNLCFLFPTATTTRVIQCSFCSKMEWTVGTTFTSSLWLWNGNFYNEAFQGVLATGDIVQKCDDNLFLIHWQPTKAERKRATICDSDNPLLLSTKRHVSFCFFRQQRCCKAVWFLCDLTKFINHLTVVAQPVSCFLSLRCAFVLQWHPAITKCHGTQKNVRHSEDPVIMNYLANDKNIRYSGVTKLNPAEEWDIQHAKQSQTCMWTATFKWSKALKSFKVKVFLSWPKGVVFGLLTNCIIMSFLLTVSERKKHAL